MNFDCVPLRSEQENIRNKQSILLRDHQMQLELIKQKLKNNMKVYCTKQGNQQIKRNKIEILIHTNQKYRAQLNQEEQISNLKIQNLKKESQDIVSLNIIQQGEINKFKLEQPQREDLLNEQYQLRLEEIQNYYSQFLKLNGKEKYKMLNKQNELMQKEKVLNEQINNQFSLIQLLEIEQLDKISIINYNEKDLQKLQIDLLNLNNQQKKNKNENQWQQKSIYNNYEIVVKEYEKRIRKLKILNIIISQFL